VKLVEYENSEQWAKAQDEADPLGRFRSRFHVPANTVYLAGNSLGLQPKKAREYIEAELDDWAKLGVEGHFKAGNPWLSYHELLTDQTARLVGANPSEVVVMNTLTVNLHLMMVSFYRPTRERNKILIEAGAFPSDQYAVASQAALHGGEVVELERKENPEDRIDRDGSSIALVMLGNVNYLTGEAFDMQAIARAAHQKGCMVGFNLAHGAGNLALRLHDDDVDFAVWCSYKYLNAGPGSVAGCFVHERHAADKKLPRFAGWWGHNKKTRFQMGAVFDPIPGAEGWQLSNPPIFQLAALRASMEIFDEATMSEIRKKSEVLTGYLEFLLDRLPGGFSEMITPREPQRRGSQLSLRIRKDAKSLVEKLGAAGVICDFREPDIVRVAPAPLYNTFTDVWHFARILEHYASGKA
jgi:kynureninase